MIVHRIEVIVSALAAIGGGLALWLDWHGAASNIRQQHEEVTSKGWPKLFRSNPPGSERAAGFVIALVGFGLLVLGIVGFNR